MQLPCHTCKDVYPVLDNTALGMRYRCPECQKLSGACWADEASAGQDWHKLNDPKHLPTVTYHKGTQWDFNWKPYEPKTAVCSGGPWADLESPKTAVWLIWLD